jgi:hypothetical protein
VRFLPILAALFWHERPNNESLYRIVPGTILSLILIGLEARLLESLPVQVREIS